MLHEPSSESVKEGNNLTAQTLVEQELVSPGGVVGNSPNINEIVEKILVQANESSFGQP